MSPAPSSQIRHEQIVEAARALFVRLGYRRSSMDEIATEAGLAKRTLYLHFDSKEAIFRAMLDACEAGIQARAAEAEAGRGELVKALADLLYAYVGTALEWFEDGRHLREVETLVAKDPANFGVRDVQVELTRRVAALIGTARGVSGDAQPAIDAVARVAVFAAMGAKHGPDVDPSLYRGRVQEIAQCLCAVLPGTTDPQVAAIGRANESTSAN